MEPQQTTKAILFLGETLGFWIQTGAFLASAIAGIAVIFHNGKQARTRALIDLIIHQKTDSELLQAIAIVYKLHDANHQFSLEVKSKGVNRTAILKVLNNQEFIAVGIRKKAFDESVYKQMQCSNVIKLWKASSGFIHELRKTDSKDTLFQDFEKLAKKWESDPIKKIT